MNILKSINAFFTAPQSDPTATAARNRFNAASDAFDTEFAAIETYTTRANHRYTILRLSHSTQDADAYDEVVAQYTDPADFEPYTEEYLDGHTAAIDVLTAAFDALTAAFVAFSPADHLFKPAAGIYKASTALYVFATNAYSNAVHCAMTTALEGRLQAAKDEFEIDLLQAKAERATAANAATVNAKLLALRTSVAKNAAAAERLEQKATEAEARAEILGAKASSAAAKAEALEASQ